MAAYFSHGGERGNGVEVNSSRCEPLLTRLYETPGRVKILPDPFHVMCLMVAHGLVIGRYRAVLLNP